MTRRTLIVALVLMASCASSPVALDAGVPDAGHSSDAGQSPDAGTPDSGDAGYWSCSSTGDWDVPVPGLAAGLGPACRSDGACPRTAAWCCPATAQLEDLHDGGVRAGERVCTGPDDDAPVYCSATFRCVAGTCPCGLECCTSRLTSEQLSSTSCVPAGTCVDQPPDLAGRIILRRLICDAVHPCPDAGACQYRSCFGLTVGFCGDVSAAGWCN